MEYGFEPFKILFLAKRSASFCKFAKNKKKLQTGEPFAKVVLYVKKKASY